MSEDNFIAAARWLKRGFSLLPCQPGTKRIVAGYGPHQKQVTDLDGIEYWFEDREVNMAVCRGQGQIILDFDDPELYKSWIDRHPIIKTTYTEVTPGRGGYHVFMYGNMPEGVKWLPGVELPLFVMSYPSVVNGKQYKPGKGEVILINDLQIFSDLSEPGKPTAYLQMVRQTSKPIHSPEQIRSVVDRIKQSYRIDDMVREVSPEYYSKLQHKGAYMIGNCFMHADKKKHFCINLQTNKFNCFKCGAHGDIIDLYALLKGIDNKEAIEELKGRIA
jgi:hypothetical protein